MSYETASTLVIGLVTVVATTLILWLIARGSPRRRSGPDDASEE